MDEQAKDAHLVTVGNVPGSARKQGLFIVGLATERECERAIRERFKGDLNIWVRAEGRLTPGFLKDLKPPLLHGEVRPHGH